MAEGMALRWKHKPLISQSHEISSLFLRHIEHILFLVKILSIHDKCYKEGNKILSSYSIEDRNVKFLSKLTERKDFNRNSQILSILHKISSVENISCHLRYFDWEHLKHFLPLMLLRLRTFSYLHYYKTSSVKNISHTIQHIVYVYSCTLNGRPTHILPMHWITIIKWVFLVCENEDSLGRVFHRSANIIKHNVGIYIERERKTEKGV